MQGGELVVGAGIARDQVQAFYRYIEPGAVGVLESDELRGLAAGFQGLQPPIAAHAVGLVDHGGAWPQFGEVTDGQLVGIGGLLAAPALAHYLSVELGLADHGQPGIGQPQSRLELAFGNRDGVLGDEEVGKVLDMGQCQA